MKKILFASAILILASACTETRDDSLTPPVLTEEPTDTPDTDLDTDALEEIRIFQSDDEGVTEYLKSVSQENGTNVWYYYTEKNKKPILLGVVKHRGMEMVYFLSSPDVNYDILPSECGFTLAENDEKSQWYEQISPNCNPHQ